MDTIFALATARGKAGVAIVRISGPLAHDVVRKLAGRVPPVRQATLCVLRDGDDLLDEGLVLIFDQEASYTGERSAELQLHGSQAVVSAVLRSLSGMPGLRMAEAGEFTRRALESGRLDLAQVEGLADLIDAETEAQRKQAQKVLSGAIGARAEDWRRRLIRAAALLEATIDFADEDVPVDVTPEVLGLLEGLVGDLRTEADGAHAAERIRDGFEVAIVGHPNSGKSTLLNALAGREAAITSAVAGTTRDVIEVRMEIAGQAVTLLDTAGVREAADEVERLGIDRALNRASAADLRVFIADAQGVPDGIARIPGDIVLRGKADLSSSWADGHLQGISGATGEGVADLLAGIAEQLSKRVAGAGTIVRERQRIALSSAIDALESARDELLRRDSRTELAAEDIRRAVSALDMLVGRIGVETLLGEIFASFCIGK
ncbi:MAG: tRNA uridine-5-carboxymethylaminomethyl(34) synthesis GTPase MnmE [Cereibacter sphaeroides]|uniref:tRNA modification GTPase MnmE n=1 Tax=Cereibacter sphaeroides TaxID=1063 RepID=A0A2W5SEG4_CERSP|nr:MAG: tRNA uridine-5-carboxymethylaminomethyl(34) synthesis GTPase MnmE [Cereibacter sphaeroides]